MIKLKDLNIRMQRSSRPGESLEGVEYMRVSTRDINDATGIFTEPSRMTRDTKVGPKKIIERHKIRRGDIIFSDKGSFATIGLIAEDPIVSCVCNHGILKISCGDNINLAYVIRDMLGIFRESKEYQGVKLTPEVVGKIQIQIPDDKVFSDHMRLSKKVKAGMSKLGTLLYKIEAEYESLLKETYHPAYCKHVNKEEESEIGWRRHDILVDILDKIEKIKI